MTYSDVKKAGLTLTEVSIPHRFWTARFQVGAIEAPAAAISAAYGWFQSMVDDLAEPIVTRAIQPPKEPGERLGPPKSQAAPVDDDGLHETEILQYALQKKPDGKYLLEMYPNIKGRPGQWPEVRFTAADLRPLPRTAFDVGVHLQKVLAVRFLLKRVLEDLRFVQAIIVNRRGL